MRAINSGDGVGTVSKVGFGCRRTPEDIRESSNVANAEWDPPRDDWQRVLHDDMFLNGPTGAFNLLHVHCWFGCDFLAVVGDGTTSDGPLARGASNFVDGGPTTHSVEIVFVGDGSTVHWRVVRQTLSTLV